MEADLRSVKNASEDLIFFEKEGYYSLNVLENKIKEIDTVKFLKSLIWNNNFHLYQPIRSTYDDLIGSGNIKLIKNNTLKVSLSKYYTKDDWMGQFGERVKGTYWNVMREEIFKSIDPFVMGGYFESVYFPDQTPTIRLEDIEVDFFEIKNINL